MNEQVLAVQRMQDYIEAHTDEEITMADLSKTALFSPWYSYRIFKALTGITPSDYIRRLRLSRSALKLKNEKARVADIAFEMGFGSVDGYQRAFLREFGCNPKEYAKNPVPITLFIPYGVKFRELRKEETTMENVKNVFIQQLHKPARKVIIKRGKKAEDYFAYCEEVGCDVWGTLTSMDSLCGEPVCLWLTEKYRKPDTSVYVQGVEVPLDYSGVIPDGFDVIELPECDYLMFQGEPFKEEDYCEAITAVQQSMERYVPSVIGFEWDKNEPKIQLEPIGERGYIELKAIRKK
ncbi:MAG: helix-turn-helix transcriptional regulator [Ruminococcaceae bacterium]|nr:helix-turn-helix transcriptional regulator [Oscillospiraceae bacterium]